MLQLRVIAPPERTDDVTGLLDECDGVATLTVFRDSSVRPPGDLVIADVARESVEGLMNGLREMGVDSAGSISLITIDATVSKAAEYAEKAAPGEGADAVIWEEAVRRTSEESVLSRTFVMFLTLATLLAGIAVLLDSAILVVGAVFISVTTVPAAGNFAVALALGDRAEMAGSAAQLGINVGAIVVAGVLTVVVYKLVQRSVRRRRSG